MDGNKINVLFVCGMGMGTSTMAELGVKRALDNLKISANVQHCSLGQMESNRSWADIIVILRNLMRQVTIAEGEHFIPVVNIMDAKGIASKIQEIVDAEYPAAKG